jgi:hypothetical protein
MPGAAIFGVKNITLSPNNGKIFGTYPQLSGVHRGDLIYNVADLFTPQDILRGDLKQQ